MTDEDKIKWFDETMKWLSQWNDSETMISIADSGADAVSDLFLMLLNSGRRYTRVSLNIQ